MLLATKMSPFSFTFSCWNFVGSNVFVPFAFEFLYNRTLVLNNCLQKNIDVDSTREQVSC